MQRIAILLSIVLVLWTDPGNGHQTCGCDIEDLKKVIEEEINIIFQSKKSELKGDKGEEGKPVIKLFIMTQFSEEN